MKILLENSTKLDFEFLGGIIPVSKMNTCYLRPTSNRMNATINAIHLFVHLSPSIKGGKGGLV